MNNSILVLEKIKNYIVIKIPRYFMDRINFGAPKLTKDKALKILKAGMKEYKQGKTKTLTSLKELRYGN